MTGPGRIADDVVARYLASHDPHELIGSRWSRRFGPLDVDLTIIDVMVGDDGRVLVTGRRGWITLRSLLTRYERLL